MMSKPYHLWSYKRKQRLARTIAGGLLLFIVALTLIMTYVVPATFGGGCR